MGVGGGFQSPTHFISKMVNFWKFGRTIFMARLSTWTERPSHPHTWSNNPSSVPVAPCIVWSPSCQFSIDVVNPNPKTLQTPWRILEKRVNLSYRTYRKRYQHYPQHMSHKQWSVFLSPEVPIEGFPSKIKWK